MKVWRTGTTVWSPARARTSSSPGSTSIPWSAATAIELLERPLEREPARREQNREVEEHVGRLRVQAVVRLALRRACLLVGLLAHLLADVGRIGEQAGGVARLGVTAVPPGRNRALERRQRLVGRELHFAAEEARALPGVARRPGRLDQRQQRVGVAVVAKRANLLHVARGGALVPQPVAGTAEEVRLPRLAREAQRL